MNKEFRKEIKDSDEYRNGRLEELLRFYPVITIGTEEILAGKRDAAVLLCLKLLEARSSISDKYGMETSAGRRRSAIDIYRHLKPYRPKLTLFAVMQTLYQLDAVEGKLVSCYCNNVKRRVFILKETFPHKESMHYFTDDEFGLEFPQWEDI